MPSACCHRSPKNHVPYVRPRARSTRTKHVTHALVPRCSAHVTAAHASRSCAVKICRVSPPPYTACAQPRCSQAPSTIPSLAHDEINPLECRPPFVFNRRKHRSRTAPDCFECNLPSINSCYTEAETRAARVQIESDPPTASPLGRFSFRKKSI